MAYEFEEKYNFTEKRKQLYEETCEKGIGWNIPYAKGTFKVDKDGKLELAQPKAKRLFQDVMSKYVKYITIEGGVRGGKDVYGLYCWANYLMICPDSLHLVTGLSSKHATETVLDSNGFGLRYLLPHGEEMLVKNINTYRFLDFYGKIKTILFYSGADADSYNAFHGFTIGSCYVNEAINQSIKTILEEKFRTLNSSWFKIIHTQNPQAGTFNYYTEYEEKLIATPYQVEEIHEKAKKYQKDYVKYRNKRENKKVEAKKLILKKVLELTGLNSMEDVTANQAVYQKYTLLVRDAMLQIDRSYEEKLGSAYTNFREYYTNPNNVKNGLYFRYYHFTIDDNLSFNKKDREDIKSTYDKTSLIYRRNIEGIRASNDNAIFDTFSPDNILHDTIPEYSVGDRYIVIDYGLKNAFVCLDCDVNTREGFVSRIWKEYRFDGRKSEKENSKVLPTDNLYLNEVKKMIASRNKGQYLCVIIDPSATSMFNLLRANGIATLKAKNAVGTRNTTTEYGKLDKSLTGIWLVRDGFARDKIFIHESCTEGINEVVGYSLEPNALATGIEKPIKVNDHFPDALRYLINTVVKDVKRWL